MESWFRAAARFEHFQHPVSDEKSAYNVAGGGDDRNRAKHGGERSFVFAREKNGAHHCDRVERVGERHQRRVQQGRHAANHFKAHERGQHENIEAGDQIHFHRQSVPFCSATRGGSAKNSRTLGLTSSPPCVSRVLLIMSVSRLSCSFPSFTSKLRNAEMLRAYIWLAW